MPFDLFTTLQTTPGWDRMTAYQRTMRCCERLTAEGLPIPAWLGLFGP